MNDLVARGVLVFAASQAAGCIITSDDTTAIGQSITVSWTLTTSATGQPAACPAGFDTAALYSLLVDDNGNAVGPEPTIDLFDCTAGTGESSLLPPGYFEEWIEITNADNSMQLAKSKSNLDDGQVLSLDTTPLQYATEVSVDGGFFRVGWNLVGAQTATPLTCEEAGVSGGIQLTATGAGSSTMSTQLFPCIDASALTASVPSGMYVVAANAIGAADHSLGSSSTLDETIAAPSALTPVTDTGSMMIPITDM